MSYQAVLFDLDGTLVNTLGDIAVAMNRILQQRGWPAHDEADYRMLVAEGVEALIAGALPEAQRDPATVRSCLQEFDEEYGRTAGTSAQAYPGIGDLLDGIETRGLRKAVLSNTQHELAGRVVGRVFDEGRFDFVQGAREGLPVKPHPGSALALSQLLGAEPERVLYLGDSGVDMHTARAAGMFPVGALWGFRTRKELVDAGAACTVADPREVLALLDGRPK